MTATLAPVIRQRFFDNDGAPLSNGKLYTYAAGSARGVNKATWVDYNQVADNTNPIVLDDAGYCDLYLDETEPYQFVLNDELGNLIFDRDWQYAPGAQVKIELDAFIAALDAAAVKYTMNAAGAALRNVRDRLDEKISVKNFGAKGDGATDDAAAIRIAIVYCQLTLSTLYFPRGIYRIGSNIAINGNPIAIVGDGYSPLQQGSQPPAVTFRWTGGAAPMFTANVAACRFVGFAVENNTALTSAILATAGPHLFLEGLSFLAKITNVRAVKAAVQSIGPNLGNSSIRNIQWNTGFSPAFLDIDGAGSLGGNPNMEISHQCLFESVAGLAGWVVKLKDTNFNWISIHGNTINQQNGSLKIFDSSDTPQVSVCTAFAYYDNEWNVNADVAADRAFNFVNVQNISMHSNYIRGGGNCTSWAELTNSTVTEFDSNWVIAMAGPLFHVNDTLSSVDPTGRNIFSIGNTLGLVNDGAVNSGFPTIPAVNAGVTLVFPNSVCFGGVIRINCSVVGTETTLAVTGNADARGPLPRGKVFGIMVQNTSGGVIGPIHLGGTPIHLAGAPTVFPSPADGKNFTIFFLYDGASLIEIGRASGDVNN